MIPKRGFYTVRGLDPSGTGEREFKIAAKQVDHLERHGPAHRYYELISACEVLKSPLLIFEGLQRDGQEKGLCYIGCPKRYGHDWSAPGHKNMLFLVCLTKEMTIFEWGWEMEDRQNSGFPLDMKRRFTKVKWKR